MKLRPRRQHVAGPRVSAVKLSGGVVEYSNIMKIVRIRPLEDCLDDSTTREVLFDQPVGRGFILYLGEAGELQYFPNFARPFYRLDVPDLFVFKGVEGNLTARIILSQSCQDQALSRFVSLVESYALRRVEQIP